MPYPVPDRDLRAASAPADSAVPSDAVAAAAAVSPAAVDASPDGGSVRVSGDGPSAAEPADADAVVVDGDVGAPYELDGPDRARAPDGRAVDGSA